MRLMNGAKRVAYGAGYAWATVTFNPRLLMARQAGRELRSEFRRGHEDHGRKIVAEGRAAIARMQAMEALDIQLGEEIPVTEAAAA